MFFIRIAELNMSTGIEKRKASFIKVVSNIKIGSVHFDVKLTFHFCIDIVSKSASNPLNDFVRLKRFLGLVEKSVNSCK